MERDEKGTLTIATDNLWTVSTNEEESKEEANNVYNLPSTKQSIRYLHAAAGFPVKSEWIKAIKAGNYVTWPELTTEAVSKHFPESDETHKEHMKQQRQNVRSTKVRVLNVDFALKLRIYRSLKSLICLK